MLKKKKNANTNISSPSSRLTLFEVSYDTKNSRVIFPVGSNASILLKQIWERACHYILQMKAVQVPNKFVLVTKSIPTENIFL